MDHKNIYSPSENTLFAAIEKCLLSTNFWTENNLTLENGGLYNYYYSVGDNAQKTSIFSDSKDAESGMSFTNETTIHKAYLIGSTKYDGDNALEFSINGTKIFNVNKDHLKYYAYDITQLLENDTNNEIQIRQDKNSDPTYTYKESSYYCIIVWS